MKWNNRLKVKKNIYLDICLKVNMNRLEYYNRQKISWEDSEIQDIRREYVDGQMTISQIGDLHRRTPGSISYALKRIDVIADTTLARGYSDYKESELYKEIVETPKTNKLDKEQSRGIWTNLEEQQLLNELEINMDHVTIAANHKRTIGGIRKRIKKMIINMHNSGKTVKEIEEITKMTQQQINFIIRYSSNSEQKSLIQINTPVHEIIPPIQTEIQQIKQDLTEIKTELKTFSKEMSMLKKSVGQMMVMIKQIYEFETEQ